MRFDSTHDSSKNHLFLIPFTIKIRIVYKSGDRATVYFFSHVPQRESAPFRCSYKLSRGYISAKLEWS